MPKPKTELNPYALYFARPTPQGPALSRLKELTDCFHTSHEGLFFILQRKDFDAVRGEPAFQYVEMRPVGILTIDEMHARNAFPQEFARRLKERNILRERTYHY